MKSLFLITFICLFSNQTTAQPKTESYLSQKNLVGIWQKNSPRVGNGLNQNFEFYKDGRFVMNVGNWDDDAVSTLKLKGSYRLTKNALYFTITLRIVVADDAEITMVDSGINYGIFAFTGKTREIKIAHPKEMADPAYITLLGHNKIKINSEVYYKL